jgi:hypothetical protein
MHVRTSLIFTSKNVFVFPKTSRKNDDQGGGQGQQAVCVRVGWDDNGGVEMTMLLQNGQTNKGMDAYLCRIPDPRIAAGVAESKIILALKVAAGGGGGGEKAHNEEQRGYGKTRVEPPFEGGDRSRAGRHLPALVARLNASLRAPLQASLIN